jgi:hypothetical protein
MYSLILADGTVLSNLHRFPNNVFWCEGNQLAANILTDSNLAFATVELDGELEDVLIDYTLQNLCVQGGYIQFRLKSNT